MAASMFDARKIRLNWRTSSSIVFLVFGMEDRLKERYKFPRGLAWEPVAERTELRRHSRYQMDVGPGLK